MSEIRQRGSGAAGRGAAARHASRRPSEQFPCGTVSPPALRSPKGAIFFKKCTLEKKIKLIRAKQILPLHTRIFTDTCCCSPMGSGPGLQQIISIAQVFISNVLAKAYLQRLTGRTAAHPIAGRRRTEGWALGDWPLLALVLLHAQTRGLEHSPGQGSSGTGLIPGQGSSRDRARPGTGCGTCRDALRNGSKKMGWIPRNHQAESGKTQRSEVWMPFVPLTAPCLEYTHEQRMLIS